MPTDKINDRTAQTGTNPPAKIEERVDSITEQLGNIINRVAEKIKASNNILVALSRDPSVDEISAAIGLTMILNKIGKHATAIYSGETPNALEFLKPEQTFEKDTNSLQDFIIALNKDKADHLRYKIEGDYVKVYITPYKTTISKEDLEFSQGDFNVDLVISIDVENAESLDGALSEYGRIMHDATAINITTNQAGRFAELEWSDPAESSVCEMIVNLAGYLDASDFDQPTATALLTGIVSATDRFSNARTTSETMQVSSRLMQSGADQQLISSNIMEPTQPTPENNISIETPANPNLNTSIPAQDQTSPVSNNSASTVPQPEIAMTPEPLIPAPSLTSIPTSNPNSIPGPASIPTPIPVPAPAPTPIPVPAPAPTPIPAPTQNPATLATPVTPTKLDDPTIPDLQFIPSEQNPLTPNPTPTPTLNPNLTQFPAEVPAPNPISAPTPNPTPTIPNLPLAPAPSIDALSTVMPPVVATVPDPILSPPTPTTPQPPVLSITPVQEPASTTAPAPTQTPSPVLTEASASPILDPSAFQIPNTQ